ncbi:ATP-binding protein [Anabaena catenula]|uniref:Serine/threonine-protein kinase PknK n=1 Tax=Anabaena catenula FACHB-362 TaxID=2692877 RepID=A0ABR8JAY8_9NOST|nr:serine/threonine-protein kinase PknK [Anabaena catenula]MBD2694683.1 serine/threonine-protein kinase PknK [Anabaena catenula FACHB-362]
MFEILGYTNLNKIYESDNSLVFRGICQQDESPVIIKILKQDYPTKEAIARYKLEYQLVSSLQLQGTVRAKSLEKYQNTLAIIFEDDGCESLRLLLSQRKLPLQEFLEIGIQITQTLAEIHAENIIHHDINPANIIIHPQTQQVKIIDFGIATILTRETPNLCHPNILEGTLAYISPEQTGRMNRVIDYRTDFYSLGVTFYEMLTHQLPFAAADAMELVHCHLAKQAIIPHLINPEIPPDISNIIIKLLSKTAEERYHSAIGIQADLQECLRQLKQTGKILEFSLAQQDISDKFQISQKLYGRETEIATLKAVVERVSQGTSELILISGYSGIGKTALVQEIYQPLTQKRGYFISGKYNQLQRNIPYSALIQAWRELMRQLLTETEAEIAAWKEKMLAAVQSNGQVIINVIPEVELIIGAQPDVPELPPKEAQNRFNLVFQNFISVFTQKEHPVVIFIDDLQWADIASLNLIEYLMTQQQKKYLLLIGAYRDNEVSQAHPLFLTLDNIKKAEVTINYLYLEPLEITSISQLISDSLKCKQERALPLAKLGLEKTAGNPFFLIEFLKFIYNKQLLNFNITQREWEWNIARIKAAPIAENVVELMADKITELPESTQQILKLAACIGNQFDLFLLSVINNSNLVITEQKLRNAVQEGLVVPIGNSYKLISAQLIDADTRVAYKFIHDRVQQAAYSLIPEQQKPAIHLKIGQLLLQNSSIQEQEEKMFDIVNQLNNAIDVIDHQHQRDELAKLNLIAAKKAKASTAYQSAFIYLQKSVQLLAANRWEKQYDLTLIIYIEVAEAAYLCGQYQEMEQFVSIGLQNAKLTLDKIKIYEVKIVALITQRKLIEAIQLGIKVLKFLGINFPQNPSKLNIMMGLFTLKLHLLDKRIDELINLSDIQNLEKKTAIRIINIIASAAYIAKPELFPLLTFKIISLSIKYGSDDKVLLMYLYYGIILCGTIGDIESGYKFGQLGFKFLQKLNAQKLGTRILVILSYGIRHWKEHCRQTLPALLEAYVLGIETGDLEYSAYAIGIYATYAWMVGKELVTLGEELSKYADTVNKIHQGININNINLSRQMLLNLMGESKKPCYLIGKLYDEIERLSIDIAVNDRNSIFHIYLYKLILCFLFEDYEQAIENSQNAKKYFEGAAGSMSIPVLYFYDSLSNLSGYKKTLKSNKNKYF